MHGGPSNARKMTWESSRAGVNSAVHGYGDTRPMQHAKTPRVRIPKTRRTWHLGIFGITPRKTGILTWQNLYRAKLVNLAR